METHTATETVAANVRRIRLMDRVGGPLTASQLARRLGWSKQVVSKLETGARNITVDDLLALAVALEVAPAVLLTPWEDDERLRIVVGDMDDPSGRAYELEGELAFGWIVGAPPAHGLIGIMVNPVTYFDTAPLSVMRSFGRHWMRQVREEMGWKVSDDGTRIETPAGMTIRRSAGKVGVFSGSPEALDAAMKDLNEEGES